MNKKNLKKIKEYFEERKSQNKKRFIRFAWISGIWFLIMVISTVVIFLFTTISTIFILQLLLWSLALIGQVFAMVQFDTFWRVDEQILKLIENLEE